MVSVNPLEREIQLKLVYYGPGLGGKTTTLQHIHATTAPGHRGKLVSLATPVDRTLYFDYLPVRLPAIGGYTLKLQLFTVPGQVHFNATRKLVLSNADGVVFVADSQRSRVDANMESMDNLKSNLQESQLDYDRIPLVLHYNKRDLDDIFPLDELDAALNARRVPSLGTCALTGKGVYEGLELLTKEVLRDLKQRDVLARKDNKVKRTHISFEEEREGISDRVQAYSARVAHARESLHAQPKSIATESEEGRRDTPAKDDSIPQQLKALDRPTIPAPFALTEKTVAEKRRTALPVRLDAFLSFASFWPEDARHRAVDVEGLLGDAQYEKAMQLIASELDIAIAILGREMPKSSKQTLFAFLELDGGQYRDITAAAASADPATTEEDALRAYLFLLLVFDRSR